MTPHSQFKPVNIWAFIVVEYITVHDRAFQDPYKKRTFITAQLCEGGCIRSMDG